MGASKAEIFSEDQNKLAGIARVLGHPARIAILEHLFRTESCICGDLVQEIGLSQPTISQHLKELKNLGLIKGTIEGTTVCYCIEEKTWQEMSSFLGTFLTQVPHASDCCSSSL